MYNYNATVDRVIDGDTVDLIVDLGFDIFHKIRVRINDIDAPEVRTLDLTEKAAGFESKEFVESELSNDDVVVYVSESFVTGKYGRCIGDILYTKLDGDQVSLRDQLLIEGHAVVKDY